MSKSKKKTGFTALVANFAKGELPIILAPDTYRTYEKKNKPLSIDAIKNFLLDEGEEIDEFTEFVPCFRLPDSSKFYGLIFWKAGLMEYHYILITFDKKGYFINKKRVGGTIRDENSFIVQVATIENSWKIEVKEGKSDENTKNLTPTSFFRHHQINISKEGIITNE